ncbi:sigma-E processing peptidase SpoIIGA [Desulfuribacillus alkaliarsenatis]|uniref:Sigma-E processing peptidase SpoIIGA n=1 Tax=Desulfuribacillus alkaliarsenatis TaxID=766136 RepID=A0A1E5G0U2_9FIRM|nr:sigma-E processing peptidase SpoIIGA [Desulfuribacillus alkaliarsenatis]OEF96068.1 sigma-E processing peptidase SpoIIGA [Desulfuribacillus alkaliarsenatis]
MKYVYIDIIFLINFFVDLSLLVFTAIYSNRKIKKFRLVIAALLGAIYGTLWVFYINIFFYTLLGKLLFSFILILTAFPWVNIKVYVKTITTFYLINFVTAGAIFSLQMLMLNNQSIYNSWIQLSEDNIWIIEVSAISLVFGIPLTYCLIKSMWLQIKKLTWEQSCIYKCEVHYKNKMVVFNGLLDTGNQLTDPITQKPVSIVEYNTVKNIVPEFVNTVYAVKSLNIADIHQHIHKNSAYDTFTVIPYRSVGSNNDYLLAFKTDSIVLKSKEGEIYQDGALVGIVNQCLSSNGRFTAIIHPQLLEGKMIKREETLNELISEKNPHITKA